MVRVLIGVASYGDGKAAFWRCLDDLRQFSSSRRISTELCVLRGCYVDQARNILASRAKNDPEGFDYLLFLDDDMVFGLDTLARLIAHGKDIVVANYYRKQSPHLPVVSVLDKAGRLLTVHVDPAGQSDLRRVACGGTGVCLIRVEVFRKMAFPWFVNEYSLPMEGEAPTEMIEGYVLIGEDTRFFMLAHQYDFSVWCDFSIEAHHMGEKAYSYRDFLEAKKALGGSEPLPDGPAGNGAVKAASAE